MLPIKKIGLFAYFIFTGLPVHLCTPWCESEDQNKAQELSSSPKWVLSLHSDHQAWRQTPLSAEPSHLTEREAHAAHNFGK